MYKKEYLYINQYISIALYLLLCCTISLQATSESITDQDIPILDFSEPTEMQSPVQPTSEQKIAPPASNSTPLTTEEIPLLTPEPTDKTIDVETVETNSANPAPPSVIPPQKETSSEDSLSTEEEIAAGTVTAGAAGALGVGLKTFAVDLMKDVATDKVKEKMDTSSKKQKGATKRNLALQKELVNDRHVQAARKVEYYFKTDNTAKKEKWEQRLKKSKKLQAKINQQEELRKKNKMENLSSEEKTFNKLKQKELSKKVLGSEERRLNARLHKYSEQPGELSQKQLIKKEQTKNNLKNINQENNMHDAPDDTNKIKKKSILPEKPIIKKVFSQGKRP